ncbi:MAG: PTS sugar transporter subunit IIB [Thomasclavelia sp.]|jgi:PTS system cellobiose-specific IIB component|nr:PTS sugar transporter subunit IIB [Tissierellia bacterium]MDD8048786.1 PTS sugar transporter subunit IIB [Thomasclavelia sp.]
MKKIMLVCAAGMSTSLLVTKMKKAAEAKGEEVEIFALPISEGEKQLASVDCVLLGPQVRYQKSEVERLISETGKNIPCDVINMKDYGMMNGEAVYTFAKQLMGE